MTKNKTRAPNPGTHSQARPIPPPNGDRNQTDPKPSLFSAIAPKPAPPNGGDDRVRTDDPLLAKQVLSQLSYVPRPVETITPEGKTS